MAPHGFGRGCTDGTTRIWARMYGWHYTDLGADVRMKRLIGKLVNCQSITEDRDSGMKEILFVDMG